MKSLFILFGISLLSLLECSKRQTDFFPLVPGAVRVMQVYEEKVVGKDTTVSEETKVTEVVKGRKKIPQLGDVWVVEAPLTAGKSTVYFYECSGDTIFKIVPGRGGRAERIVYLIQPLAIGKKWFESEAKRELNEVVALESVSVPAGVFQNCYKVQTISRQVNFQQYLWLVPGLGVVKREKRQTWTQGDTTWSLLRKEDLVEYRVMSKGK